MSTQTGLLDVLPTLDSLDVVPVTHRGYVGLRGRAVGTVSPSPTPYQARVSGGRADGR
jgi:hypothetical protein